MTSHQRWEYRTNLVSVTGKITASGFHKETEKFSELLNAAGYEGWELTFVQDLGLTGGLSGTNSRNMMAVFKRPRPV
ncbi:MAG: DUF4177 domain-containing protein [Aquihabitans sp.]